MKMLTITAELTGTVWKVVAAVGESVEEDQALLILESMKMEIPAVAPRAGTLREIKVKEGDPVKEGQALAIIELG